MKFKWFWTEAHRRYDRLISSHRDFMETRLHLPSEVLNELPVTFKGQTATKKHLKPFHALSI